jgi:hypothetical protein
MVNATWVIPSIGVERHDLNELFIEHREPGRSEPIHLSRHYRGQSWPDWGSVNVAVVDPAGGFLAGSQNAT